ncbi:MULTISPECIES: MBL fold metallo-hydrolase [unclassified Thioalkalivibrio]|uniref:MBL fold metallo-hydrolase n=1 Tax=unclassified Thioalkalivibrio TaxID=2621013 RepID=UPI0003642E97|nr:MULTISPECIES: MBL fold metallo-hydrolase [unclassified Thioalkalivibrio]
MLKNTRNRALLVLALAAFVLSPMLAAKEAPILPEPEAVSDHAHAWIGPYGGPDTENQGFRMNLGYVVGEDAVAVIDSGHTPEMAKEMLEHIRATTDKPVRYVINTNSQPHRFMGNDVFREAGADILAAPGAADRMQGSASMFAMQLENALDRPEGSTEHPEPPNVMVEDRKELDLGGVTLAVRHVGSAHTHGSLIAVVEPDNVVFAGDVLYGGRLLAILPDGSMEGWLQAYELLQDEYADAKFIPGHGEPGALSTFDHPTHDYLRALWDHMFEAADMGTDMQSAIRAFDDSPWQDLADFDDLAPRNTNIAYQEAELALF